MGWNDPDKDKDPWSGKNQPPDLDEALKRFQDKLKKTFLGGKGKKSDGGDGRDSSGGLLVILVLAIAVILWALAGIFIVDPAEKAAILYFGKYRETVGPGPHWIPRIIATKVVRNVDRVMDYSYSGQMLTKDENLVSVSLVVQYHIGDLEDYLFNVSDPQESLQQATSSALREVLGTTNLDQIITEGRSVWGARVQQTLVEILGSYKTGIRIVNVSPQPARAPENVQDAFDDAIKAQEDEKRFKEQALAYAARVIPIANGNAKRITEEAEAYREQVVLRARGEVAEFLAVLPQYIASPFVTSERMYLDTMQKVLNNTSKIIVDGKAGNLLYLPLDKLSMRIPPAKNGKAELDDEESVKKEAQNLIPDTRQAGRDIIRQTYRPGRGE
ncbi:FtsH protease activity modulator HflK [Legionella israelensis]|uniref:FtsH protease activity modulator HflK n=1 Tax=Legionella israelensis TaxID=454 RepID=UPI0011803BF5|nr:FtsH protease activity modulator HflK [Legionella israelensis]QDP71811.1 FtsH protease activity modulator HflK [Legionella israelensis]